METRNRAFHRTAVDGVTVEYRSENGAIRGAQARAIDFDAETGRAVGAAYNIMIIAEAAAIIANLGENPRQKLWKSWC